MNIEQKKEIARAKMKAVLEPSVYESWLEQVDDGFNHIPWYEYGSSYDILHNSFPFAADDKIDWWGVRRKLKSGEAMNTEKVFTPKYKNAVCRGSLALGSACGKCERCKEEINKLIALTVKDDLTLEQQAEQLKSKLAEIEKAIEESKVKTKYAIGQTYYVIYENGVYLAHVFHNSVFDNSIIAMGNDAATVEEAERIIRRRKAAVVYNEIVERENAKEREDTKLQFYLMLEDGKPRHIYMHRNMPFSTDLKPVHDNAHHRVIDRLTPELINDLFCN
jgi:hypothetical protein